MAVELKLPPLRWQDRPQALQDRIDRTAQDLSKDRKSSWGLYNGSESYEMCTVSEFQYVKTIVRQAKEQTEFYVLDIGAGNFQFVRNMVKEVNEATDIREDITVHVIGVRGEGGTETRESIGKCKLYELTAFKVENLFDEFVKRGLPLENKVDFAVSRWCFRHLNDPVGTFVQTYDLLLPKTGIFIVDGFFSLSRNQTRREMFDRDYRLMVDLLVRTKAPFLMQVYRETRALNRFVLHRPDDVPCQVSMSYLENFETGVRNAQIGSECITRFDKGEELPDTDYFKFKHDHGFSLYGDKKLYDWLRNNRIIELHMGWGTTVSDVQERFKLHQAVRDGSMQEIERCLERGDSINEGDSKGYTPLHVAMQQEKMECFQFLLNNGADHTIPSCDATRYVSEDLQEKSRELTLLQEAEGRGYNSEYIKLLKAK